MIEALNLEEDFLNLEILNNSLLTWLVAIIIFAAAFCLLALIRKFGIVKLDKLAERTKLEIFNVLIKAIKIIHWPFFVITSIYISLDILDTRPIVQQWLYYLFLTVAVYYIVRAVIILIDFAAAKILEERKENEVGQIKILSSIVKVLAWMLALIILLSNFGYDVTALLAGLGIGGLAIALASQQLLGDLIGTFTIYFDKPFGAGDRIQIGDYEGEVVKIGPRSTRLRTVNGDEVILPNKDIANARLKIIKK